MYIVHNDPLAHIDQLDKAQVEIRDGRVEWHMVVDPALKVLHCISVFPSNVLFCKRKDRELSIEHHTSNGNKMIFGCLFVLHIFDGSNASDSLLLPSNDSIDQTNTHAWHKQNKKKEAPKRVIAADRML